MLQQRKWSKTLRIIREITNVRKKEEEIIVENWKKGWKTKTILKTTRVDEPDPLVQPEQVELQ